VKGSGVSLQDSSRLKVEVLLLLSWLNTSVRTNNIKHVKI